MSGPASITRLPSLDCTLREHRMRLRNLEQPLGGQWVYVLPLTPASTPDDYIANPYSPNFLNGCANIAGEQAVSFRIHPVTRLAIRGAIDLGPGGLPLVVFTLPDGFRPVSAAPVLFPSGDGSLIYTGRVDTDGSVWILGVAETV